MPPVYIEMFEELMVRIQKQQLPITDRHWIMYTLYFVNVVTTVSSLAFTDEDSVVIKLLAQKNITGQMVYFPIPWETSVRKCTCAGK